MPAATWSARARRDRAQAHRHRLALRHRAERRPLRRHHRRAGGHRGRAHAAHGVALRHPSRSSTSCPRSRATTAFPASAAARSAASSTPPCWLPAIPKAKPWRRPLRASAATRPLTAPLRRPAAPPPSSNCTSNRGPVLEARGLPIGVVTNIVGIRRVQITVEASPTTPVPRRWTSAATRWSARPASSMARIARPARPARKPVRGRHGGSAVPDAERRQRRARPRRADAGDAQRQRRRAGRIPETLMAGVAEDLKALRLSASFIELSRARPTAARRW